MKKFIAYFDYLGYQKFIENCEPERLMERIGHILRDVEMAMGNGQYNQSPRGHLIADTSTSRVNCLTISDTVIFSTQDDSIESLREILEVAKKFNYQSIFLNMPVRGVIVYDQYEMISSQNRNPQGAIYSANMIYGKGLVYAHVKAESLNWAGTVVDDSVINRINEFEDVNGFLNPYAKIFPVPYKVEPYVRNEYALKLLVDGQNKASIENKSNNVLASFARDNKPVDSERVKALINNTLEFVRSHLE